MTSISATPALMRVESDGNGGIRIPEKVIGNINAARAIFSQLYTNNLPRIVLMAEIDGMIAGNPPYDPVKLREANLTSMANFNTLEPRAWFERGALSYYNLLYTNESIINITVRGDAPELADIGGILSRNWNKVVREEWRSFDINMASLSAQLVKFGVSPGIWSDEKTFRWSVAELSKFLVPDQCQSDLDLMTVCCIENTVPITYLIEVYNQFKTGEETHWNKEQLMYLLCWLANTPVKNTFTPEDLVQLQQKITQGDLSFDNIYNESVPLVSLFYKENDGTISHYMFHRYFGMGDSSDFIYEFKSQYKKWQDFVVVFTQSPGEKYIHSNRGLGHKIFALSQAKMQGDCSLADLSRWASTPLVKTSPTAIRDADGIRINLGTATNIGGADFVNNTMGANIEPVIAASQYFSNMMQTNAAFSGDDPGVPDRSQQGSLAPTSEKFKALREYGVLRNQVSHFYNTCDVLFKEMTRRLVNLDATCPDYYIYKKFRDLCIEEGVPEILFKNKAGELPSSWEVSATRTAGAGSQLGHIVGMELLMPITGSFGRREQNAFKKDWIRATVGQEYIPSYTQDDEDSDEIAGGASLAVTENGLMKLSQNVLATATNDQRAHIGVHMALGRELMDQISVGVEGGGMDVVQGDKVFNLLIPHLQQHVSFLASNPFAKNFLEQIKKPLDEIVKYAQLNRRNAIKKLESDAKKAQEDQQKTAEVMNEEQRKNMKAIGDEKRADFKVNAQVERAKEANVNRKEAMDVKVQADIDNKRKVTDAEVASKAAKSGGAGSNGTVSPYVIGNE